MKPRGFCPGEAPGVAGVITGSIDTRTLKKAKNLGADLVEVRLDTFKDRNPSRLKSGLARIKDLGLPVLLTIRSRKEGGRYNITDAERLDLFSELIPYADLVDVELGSKGLLKEVKGSTRRHKKKLIVSYHNFKTTPRMNKLHDVIKDARRQGADIVKVATLASGREHLRRLAHILVDGKDMIVIAMGGYGAASRVFFPLLGSMITYAALTEQTAPGQLPLGKLKKMLSLFAA